MQTRTSLRLQGFDYATPGAYFVTLCTHDRACLFGDIADAEMRPSAAGEMVLRRLHDLETRFGNVCIDAHVVMPNHLHAILIINDTPPPVGAGPRPGPLRNAQPPVEDRTTGVGPFPTGAHGGAPLPVNWSPNATPVGAGPRPGPPRNAQPPVEDRMTGVGPFPAGAHGGAPLPEIWSPDANPGGAGPRPGPPRNAQPLVEDRATGVGPFPAGAHGSAPLPGLMQWFKSITTADYRHGVRDSGWPRFAGKLWQRSYYEHVLRSEGGLQRAREYIAGNPARWREDPENPRISRG